MASFKIIAFNADDFERLIYLASERQVHMHDTNLKERMSYTSHSAGLVLDPKDYPEGTRFLIVRDDK